MRFFFWPVISAAMPRSSSSLTAALAVGNFVSTRCRACATLKRGIVGSPSNRQQLIGSAFVGRPQALAAGCDQAAQVRLPSQTQAGSFAGKRREVQQYGHHPQDD
jgi:hypothetical protein